MNGKESGRQMSTQPLSRIDFLQLSISTRQESIDRVAKHDRQAARSGTIHHRCIEANMVSALLLSALPG